MSKNALKNAFLKFSAVKNAPPFKGKKIYKASNKICPVCSKLIVLQNHVSSPQTHNMTMSSESISTLIKIASSLMTSSSTNFCAPKDAFRSPVGLPRNGVFSLQVFGLMEYETCLLS
ncbi:hypothetical protein BpHYR1_034865 [Brachionus plicatilis]|uniref:Uncharacterized protein n=1 Tax=Brachionus plicatilis TaxID=10195 RepID=A0A3M7SHE2_BRAPC|nr:hypothetical protein BpHYR1_034865 [Brachionus plicatilis]